MRVWSLIVLAAMTASCTHHQPPRAQQARDDSPVVIELHVADAPSTTTQPAAGPNLVINAQPNQPFIGSMKRGADTLTAKGLVTPLPNNEYRVRVDYRSDSPSGMQSLSSTLQLLPGEERQLGGLFGAGGATRLVVLRLAK